MAINPQNSLYCRCITIAAGAGINGGCAGAAAGGRVGAGAGAEAAGPTGACMPGTTTEEEAEEGGGSYL